jgi:hypothetical protein
MSQLNVERVITRLLTDEELRLRFSLDPLDTLAELHLRGMALTPDEIELFVQSDVDIWFGDNQSDRGWFH